MYVPPPPLSLYILCTTPPVAVWLDYFSVVLYLFTIYRTRAEHETSAFLTHKECIGLESVCTLNQASF